MAYSLAIELYHHFSNKSQNVTLSSIFAVSKTLEKVMKITRFAVLRGQFIDLDQASRRMRKITQNDAKMHLKSPQNDNEKIYTPVLQWSKTHAVA